MPGDGFPVAEKCAMDEHELLRLRQQGFHCSQILLLQGLSQMGKNNPDLIRAMQGLAVGMGGAGEVCGALTGGACLLGLYAGNGVADLPEDERLSSMIRELVEWFKSEFGRQFGGIRCEEILAGDSRNKATRCPLLVMGVLQKVNELLLDQGFDLSGQED